MKWPLMRDTYIQSLSKPKKEFVLELECAWMLIIAYVWSLSATRSSRSKMVVPDKEWDVISTILTGFPWAVCIVLS